MEIVQAIVLGIVQGATEFIPVSSSGHLVWVPAVFGWETYVGNLTFDVLLHLASVIAVFGYFRHEFVRMGRAIVTRDPELGADRWLATLIAVGTFVTGVIGLAFNDFFESLFHSPAWTGFFLLCTSVILTTAERLSRRHTVAPAQMSVKQAVLIGLAQGAAIAPGISRSGATISAALGTGLSREQAARFSFMLSAPIILLVTVKEAYDAIGAPDALPGLWPSIAGFIASLVASYLAIAWLIGYLRTRSLYPFAVYTAIVGTGVIIWQVAL